MLINEKVTLCYPNRANESALTGGSWLVNLPLNNMKDRILSKVSRSTNLLTTSTTFNITFPQERSTDVIALANHNLSTSALVRIRLYANEGMTILIEDSGWFDVWPSIIPTRETEWEFDNWWDGKPRQEDIALYTKLLIHRLVETRTPKVIRIDIDDTGNPDGYVKIGRLFVSKAWQPEYNASYGISYGYSTEADIDVAMDMNRTEYFRQYTPKRTVSFSLEQLDETAGFQNILRMQKEIGITGEVLYTENSIEPMSDFAKSFIGRLSSANPLVNPYFESFSSGVDIIEIL
jgi:hypothetical protein